MTKMKSKKMTKSTFAIIIMAIAMVAMLAFGGTYAYFTAVSSGATGSFSTGTVQLANNTFTVAGTAVVPGQYILGDAESTDKAVFTDKSTAAAHIFVVFEITATAGTLPDDATLDKLLTITGSDFEAYAAKSTATRAVYYKLGDGSTETAYTFADAIQINTAIESESTEAKLGDYQGVTLSVTVTGEAIQAEGLSQEEAYNELFA